MQSKLVVSDPAVMGGKPVIAGTRISVELILEKLAAGESVEQVLDAHPRLTREAIRAALAFAAQALRADVVYPSAEPAQRTWWQTRGWIGGSWTVSAMMATRCSMSPRCSQGSPMRQCWTWPTARMRCW